MDHRRRINEVQILRKFLIIGRFIDLFKFKSAFWKIRNPGICLWLSRNGTDPKKKMIIKHPKITMRHNQMKTKNLNPPPPKKKKTSERTNKNTFDNQFPKKKIIFLLSKLKKVCQLHLESDSSKMSRFHFIDQIVKFLIRNVQASQLFSNIRYDRFRMPLLINSLRQTKNRL